MVAQFFQNQLDYVLFFYGLPFVLLAVICAALRPRPERHLPWTWLGLFGVTHGLNEWLDMLALSVGDSLVFSAVRLVIMTVSFMFLLEFGRAGWRQVSGHGPGRWIHLPLLAYALAGGFAGFSALNAAARYSFGLIGGLWAAWALLQAARRTKGVEAHSLSLAAVAMAAYALAAGLVVPRAPLLLAPVLNYASFASFAVVPIQSVRGILAALIAAAILRFHEQTRQAALPADRRSAATHDTRVLVIVLAIIVAGGWIFTERLGQEADRHGRSDLLNEAQIAAAALDTERLKSLSGTDADLSNPDYVSLRRQLVNMAGSSPQLRWLYLLFLNGHSITFPVDSIPEGSPDHAAPGEIYELPPPELFHIFDTGEAAAVGPYTDAYGSFLSGFAPLYDPSTHRVVAVLGIDVNASDWQATILHDRTLPISITLLVALMTVGFFVVRRRLWESAQWVAAGQQRLADAQRVAHIGSWTYDPSTDAVTWSEEMFRIFGCRPDRPAPSYSEHRRLIHPEDWPALDSALQTAVREAAGFELEFRIIRRADAADCEGAGATRFVAARAEPRRQGDTVHLLGTVQDITERKQAEAERDEQRRMLAALLESTPDIILFKDRDGVVRACSGLLGQLFGKPAAEIIGKTDFDFFPSEQAQRFRAEELDVMRTGKRVVAEHLLDTESGQRWFETIKLPLRDERGETTGLLSTERDITQRRNAAEALRKTHEELEHTNVELEKASRVKSEFLANMSHEIRTPLNGIIGMTGLLLDTELNAEQQDFAETIRTSGEVLLSLINDILDFSKIEAQKLELENQPFALGVCVEEALDLVAPNAAAKRLELAGQVDRQLPATFVGDVTRLRQILVNLLGNAVKFTASGEVVVSVTGESLAAGAAGQYRLHFAVRDTGPGIPPEQQGRLFQSFSQIDASTTRHFGGTGLGLAISKRLAEMMHGTIWVESSGIPGEGATFHFTIVADAAPDQEAAALSPDQINLVGRSVLIVDDNQTNRQILVHQTRSWDMAPTAVASGAEALALLQAPCPAGTEGQVRVPPPFDFAVLDLQMPDMDGAQLAERIHAELGQTLPLVLLSSLGYRPDKEIAQHFAACLTKPVKASQLHDTLMGLIAQQDSCMPAQATRPSQAQGREFDREMGRRHPLRILLAEDNVVNQKVALSLLKRIGYRADVAADGLEALDALRRQPYDVILMDAQMPDMDGEQATRRIREEWPPERQPRIIAMTANAMMGDRERYLCAGMDDYVSKPVKMAELIRALAGCQPGPTLSPVTSGSTPGEGPLSAAIDPDQLQEVEAMLADDPGMIADLVELYLDDSARLVDDMRRTAAADDLDGLRRAAHTLKGTSRQMGAVRLAVLCSELEAAEPGAAATSLPEQIQSELGRVDAELRARFIPPSQPSPVEGEGAPQG